MPQAVMHVLVPIVLVSLFRDYIIKDKDKFPLHYVLIAGIAGAIPDIDIAVYYFLSFFGFTMSELHRTFSHNIFVFLLFVILGFFAYFSKLKYKELGRHHLNLNTIFFITSIGIFIHFILDALIIGSIKPLYPFSDISIGLNIIRIFPIGWQETILSSIDAGLLILWLIYMEIRHKISDFI